MHKKNFKHGIFGKIKSSSYIDPENSIVTEEFEEVLNSENNIIDTMFLYSE